MGGAGFFLDLFGGGFLSPSAAPVPPAPEEPSEAFSVGAFRFTAWGP